MKNEQIAGANKLLEIAIDEKRFATSENGDLLVVEHLELSLEAGRIVGLIGPSGCGKTTTLRIALGLDTEFRGHVTAAHDSLRIGAVFQEPRLLPWRTVTENIRLVLPPDERDRPIDDLLETVGLAGAGALFPGELSLGMARRAALARALAVNPEFLVLDEAFVSLDETLAQKLRSLVLDIWDQRHMAILMVTHNVAEAVGMADKLVLLAPRPTKVLAEIDVPQPRRDVDRSNFLAELAAGFPGTVRLRG